jgi:hypothetical protein
MIFRFCIILMAHHILLFLYHSESLIVNKRLLMRRMHHISLRWIPHRRISHIIRWHGMRHALRHHISTLIHIRRIDGFIPFLYLFLLDYSLSSSLLFIRLLFVFFLNFRFFKFFWWDLNFLALFINFIWYG